MLDKFPFKVLTKSIVSKSVVGKYTNWSVSLDNKIKLFANIYSFKLPKTKMYWAKQTKKKYKETLQQFKLLSYKT